MTLQITVTCQRFVVVGITVVIVAVTAIIAFAADGGIKLA